MNNEREWEFLYLLEPYYKELDKEKEFKRINETQIMPSYTDYAAIAEKISYENCIRFLDFLKIYEVFWEVEKFEDFTLETAKKVLNLLNDSLFNESKFSPKKPKYATYSLIEKFKINIAYQFSKSTNKNEIIDWLLISEEIRNRWNYIDMTALMKSGCNFFMKYNGEREITDQKMLILLNKFIGNDKNYSEQLGKNALNWLKVYHDERSWITKAILSALSKNNYIISKGDKMLTEIENRLNYWKFDAKRKIKIYRRRIVAFFNNTEKQSKSLKITKQSEISEIKPLVLLPEKQVVIFRCTYKNKAAVIKEYQLKALQKEKIKEISNEIANSIYLSKHNKTRIFLRYYGLYLKTNNSEYHIGFLMEDCDSDLQSYIDNGGDVCLDEMVDSLLNGFFLLHNLGLAHNDITPKNIFIQKKGTKIQPKIADYGISSTFSSISGASLHKTVAAVKGTNSFMAPEVQDPLNNRDSFMKVNRMRADVFSLGMVFLYLITKQPPPEGKLDREDYIEIEKENVKTSWLKNILNWMLPRDPEKRKKLGEIIKLKKMQIMD
ncbi:unnamed protein product [Blepharisma stoltei]|uniref:Protein kinase domain-containing protein n=1 Tax=Blepharisma stoltei TaxID=1481888 RepID=A0AAU9JU27_9CILI|nr:unnamed protein product [Blepharisma stoltei]